MHKGQPVEQGETTSVFAAPQPPYTRWLLDAAPGARTQEASRRIA